MAVPISADLGERTFKLGGWRTEEFHVDSEATGGTTRVRLGVLGMMTRVYALGIPILAVLALLLLARRLGLSVRARVVPEIPVLALAFFGAVLVRLLLLSVITVSTAPGITVLYCAPAYALYVAAVALVLVSEAAAALERNR